MATVTGMGRRAARWMAGLAAVACCVAGAALPAQADDGPVPVPSTPPTAAPTTPLFPGRTIHMDARFEFGEHTVPGQGIKPNAYLQLVFSQWGNGWSLTEQECQDLVSTFWSGTGPDYVVEAAVKYDDCQIEAYYLGEARHAFYSLDESGHMQVRPPMAYLNQIATSFDNVLFERLDFDVTAMNNAHCNANPSKEDLNNLVVLSVYRKNLAFLFFILAGDNLNGIALLNLASHSRDPPYNTSGARETIFMNCFSLNSLATGPKIRVPLGVLSSLIITAAFSSNLI